MIEDQMTSLPWEHLTLFIQKPAESVPQRKETPVVDELIALKQTV